MNKKELLNELGKWLMGEAQRIVGGSKRLAFDNKTYCHTPDATGFYGAMWTRDFFYTVDGIPECVSDEDLKAACDYLLNGQREDGVIPDRRLVGGVSEYCAGTHQHYIGAPPLDNASFMVKLVAQYVNRTDDLYYFQSVSDKLERAMFSMEKSENGLIWAEPGVRRSTYGFVDQIGLTGDLLFCSLLFIEAASCLFDLYSKSGQPSRAKMWGAQRDAAICGLDTLWCEEESMYFAASVDCKQVDVWGSCYASYTRIASDERAKKISKRMVKSYDKAVKFGHVRHLFYPEYWNNRLDTFLDPEYVYVIPSMPGYYQNGAYWPTASGWTSATIRITNEELADKMLIDLIEYFKKNGINEAINDDPEYVGAKEYTSSATLIIKELRRIGVKTGDYSK